MKPTVYIETSVISYATSRYGRDLIITAHQQITREFWEISLQRYDAFVSPITIEEISRGDSEAAQLRLDKISSFSILEIVPEIRQLADAYFNAIQIPEKARADTYHLALTAWHGLDFLASWNCKHIVNGRIKMIIQEINADFGIRTPIICTPEELMEV